MGSESNTLLKCICEWLFTCLKCNKCNKKLPSIALKELYNRYHAILDNIVSGQLGSQVTLRCPIDESNISTPRITKTWFRGHGATLGAAIAKLVIHNSLTEYSDTLDDRMSISEPDGDLTIFNITVKDIGFYTCRFTGSRDEIIQLSLNGAFGNYHANLGDIYP